MKLNKDQIIKVLIGLVVVLLVTVAVQLMRSDDSDMEGSDEEQVMDENAESDEEGAVEEGAEEGNTAKPQAKPATTPASKPASTTSSYSGGTCYPSLTAKKDSTYNAILLDWTTCQNGDFQYYKVVKSSTNSNPSYPNDPVVVSSPNRSTANFIDKTVSPRTTYYYRVCAVQPVSKVSCGNTVSVSY